MNMYLQLEGGNLVLRGWFHDCSSNPHRDECAICAAQDGKEKT